MRSLEGAPSVRLACWSFVVLTGALGAVACGGGSDDGGGATPTSGEGRSSEEPSSPSPFGTGDAGADGPVDSDRCGQLNIGILGDPGPLPSSDFQAWLIASGTSAKRIQTDTTTPLTAEVLAPFDVVVLDALLREYTLDEAATFETWVLSGRGVVSMTGYTDTPTDLRPNSLIRRLGVEYATPQLWGPVMDFVAHPTTNGLTSVTFVGGYQVVPAGETRNTLLPLATVQGSPVAYAVEASRGRAFVWGDEWIEYDSEWKAIPQISQLWVNVFGWLAPGKCALEPPR